MNLKTRIFAAQIYNAVAPTLKSFDQIFSKILTVLVWISLGLNFIAGMLIVNQDPHTAYLHFTMTSLMFFYLVINGFLNRNSLLLNLIKRQTDNYEKLIGIMERQDKLLERAFDVNAGLQETLQDQLIKSGTMNKQAKA